VDLPYPPSWQNRFFDAFRRQLVPRHLLYVLITAASVAVNTAVAWIEGGLPAGEFDPYMLTFQVWLLVVMFAGDYYVAAAGRAIDRFRPALGVDDVEFAQLRYTYTTIPARTGWIIAAASLVFSIWGISFGRPYQQTGLSAVAMYATSVFMFWLVFFFMYFLYRIVRRTADLYARIERVNLFHLEPLYAFSGLSSRVGMFLVFAGVLSYITNFVFTESPNPAGFAFFAGINVVVAIAAFIYPLQGIHGRLDAAQDAMAAENDARLEVAYRELHRRVDAGTDAGMADLHHEVQALLEFRREIHGASTWPWGPGTLRAFISALLLPIMLWAIQQALERFVAS
jgi:hypothetical protein